MDHKRRDSTDQNRVYRVLIIDPVGLALATKHTTPAVATNAPNRITDITAVTDYVAQQQAHFHQGPVPVDARPGVHFSYQPDLREAAAIIRQSQAHDAVIAAATAIPGDAHFPLGGVRIGAGTGNMASASWGGSAGLGGQAPLMNTPGYNTTATVQMVFKALLRELPDLPVAELHNRVCARAFDTARDLGDFPTHKLAGRRIAVLGYGNIGRGVARLAQAFGMQVSVYARQPMQAWIEAEGMTFADTPAAAAANANVLSVHLGLGAPVVSPAAAGGEDLATPQQRFANTGLINTDVLAQLAPRATLINFDRGELVDVQALADALANGQVRYAAIDADVFIDLGNASKEAAFASGPMAPYLDLVARYHAQLLLLPHAAADTDHPSRVAGAKQAIKQILGAIREGCVQNLVGDLPPGYTDLGANSVPGVTPVSIADIQNLETAGSQVGALRTELARLDELLRGLEQGAVLTDDNAQSAVLAATRLRTQIQRLGLYGPYRVAEQAKAL